MININSETDLNNLTDIIDLEHIQTAYINGRYLAVDESLATFEDINPATGEVLATIQQTTDEQINEAVKAAQQGQKVWAAERAGAAGSDPFMHSKRPDAVAARRGEYAGRASVGALRVGARG